MGGSLVTSFDTTDAFLWLTKHAYRYGFVLSYPKDNTYYMYEPWHWRFVGTELADDLHDGGRTFYDMDQRDIDVYLANTFDW
jgi:D-alanyl-D-alanine carboxypeptidase